MLCFQPRHLRNPGPPRPRLPKEKHPRIVIHTPRNVRSKSFRMRFPFSRLRHRSSDYDAKGMPSTTGNRGDFGTRTDRFRITTPVPELVGFGWLESGIHQCPLIIWSSCNWYHFVSPVNGIEMSNSSPQHAQCVSDNEDSKYFFPGKNFHRNTGFDAFIVPGSQTGSGQQA